MIEPSKNNILLIGGPNVGKTHYGGQLYGRLIHRKGKYVITSPPENLTIFREVYDSLADGISAGRTHVTLNDTLSLEIEDEKNNKISFSFPDYGGEQIDKIVSERKINQTWKESINNSSAWMLFIRLDEIKPIEDIVNRGIPEQEVLESRNEGNPSLTISPSAFFIELLQILLFVKGIDTFGKASSPKLTVVLSCWDKIEGISKNCKPVDLLSERLPLVKDFIYSVWKTNSVSVIGLSSTERTLSNKTPDDEFVNKGPENFGYIITDEGKKEPDLTLSISKIIG